MVAHGVEVEAHLVHGLDRRLVVEQRRQQRAGADQVAGRDGQGVGVLLAQRAQLVGEVDGAARGDGRTAGNLRDETAATGGGLEVAVEVVDAKQLDGDVLRWLGRLCRRNRDCERGERGERKPEDARSAARMRDLHSVFPLVRS